MRSVQKACTNTLTFQLEVALLVGPGEVVDRPSNNNGRYNQKEDYNSLETTDIPILLLEFILDATSADTAGSVLNIVDLIMEADAVVVASATINVAGAGGAAAVGFRIGRSIAGSVRSGGEVGRATPLGPGTGADIIFRRRGRTRQARGGLLITPLADAAARNVQRKIIRPAIILLLAVARHGWEFFT